MICREIFFREVVWGDVTLHLDTSTATMLRLAQWEFTNLLVKLLAIEH